jgi:hypothetical protein
LLICLLVLSAAACDGGDGADVATTSSEGSAPTTTAAPAVCEDVAGRAVELVRDMVDVLEQVPFEVLVDRESWPEDLVRLDERGAALQAESDVAGCEEAIIRGAVVAAAGEMEAEGRSARFLLDLLVP